MQFINYLSSGINKLVLLTKLNNIMCLHVFLELNANPKTINLYILSEVKKSSDEIRKYFLLWNNF